MARRRLNIFEKLAFAAPIALHVLLLGIENSDLAPTWASELLRFIPYYWLLPVFAAGVLASAFMGPFRLLIGCANLLVFLVFTMGFRWNTEYRTPSAGKPIRILSYNVKALIAEHRAGGLATLTREIESYSPDIVALQDAQKWLPDGVYSPAESSAKLPFLDLPYVYVADQFILASRFKLSQCVSSSRDDEKRGLPFLQCQLDAGNQTLTVVTTHFVSPRSGLLAARTETSFGLLQWKQNVAYRGWQSNMLRDKLSQLNGPLVVLGDFNASEQSPMVENLKRAGLHDAFSEAGTGWGYTIGHALNRGIDLFRIDHILLSPAFQTRRFRVGHQGGSEHNPIFADVTLTDTKQ